MTSQIKTVLLLALLSAIIIGLGGIMGGRTGIIIAFVIAMIMNVGSYWYSDKIVLSMYQARELSEDEAPMLHRMVAELSANAGIPKPRVCVIPEDAPNAFATGRDPEHGVVAVTDGIMRILSPEELRVPDYIITDVLEANGIEYKETRSLEESMPELDILYMTRVQKERFFNEEDYIRLKNSYILTKEKMSLAKPDMAVLHPLPRVNEIALDVDDDPRAAYFEQVQNGVYVRMALIMTLLGLRDPKAPKEEN